MFYPVLQEESLVSQHCKNASIFSDEGNLDEVIKVSRSDVGRLFSTRSPASAAPGCFQHVPVDCAALLLCVFTVI